MGEPQDWIDIMIKNYQDLIVWQKAHNLVKEIYNTKFNFNDSERYGLNSQIKRAAVSIPANIVEGISRQHNKELIQFLYISKGSLNELAYYLLMSYELEYLNEKDYSQLKRKCEEIERMLGSFISKIKG